MFPSPSPRTLVITEPKNIHIRIDADPRFAAGAGGAAHYFAETAGLEHEAASLLQAATVNACLEAFAGVTPAHRRLDVRLTQFEDRVEIAIALDGGGGPALGLDSIAKSSAKALAGVDRVQYEQLDNASVTRLTKYLTTHS
jgi:hypothetical protein